MSQRGLLEPEAYHGTFFRTNGYLIRPNAVPKAVLIRAVDNLWSGVDADREDRAGWSGLRCPRRGRGFRANRVTQILNFLIP